MAFMRNLVVTAMAVAVCAAGPASASAPTLSAEAAGVRLAVPAGWRVTHVLGGCSDPHEVLALARSRKELLVGNASRYHGGLLLLLEHARYRAFPPRAHFRLVGTPTNFEGCCGPAGPGYAFSFRDRGRNFSALIYATGRAAREGVAILNTLRVS